MKNRSFLQKLMAVLTVITGILIFGCNFEIPNELQKPPDLYEKKGGLIIYNLSGTQPISSIEVKDKNNSPVDLTTITPANNPDAAIVPIDPQQAQALVLNPGAYTFTVHYPAGNPATVSQAKDIELYKYTAMYVSSDPLTVPAGILQVINLSGQSVTSVLVAGEELLSGEAVIADKESKSVSRDPDNYAVQVTLADLQVFGPETFRVVDGLVTNVLVFATGIGPDSGLPGTGETGSNNLWILNRSSSAVTDAEKKIGSGAYSSFLEAARLPLNAGLYAGARLDPGTYDIRVTVSGVPSPLVQSSVQVTDEEPVFIMVQDDGSGGVELEALTPGDTDGDGFPNWWEEKYFPDDVNDPNKPSKDGDDDGDGLTNWEEYQAGTDPTRKDTDGDGLTDWEEINGQKDSSIPRPSALPDTFPITDPLKKDTDGDGLTDWEEITGQRDSSIPNRPSGFPDTFPKTDPLKPDTDGDGYPDFAEIRDKTDPNNPNKFPGSIIIVLPWGN
jgi:hypothetical protein